MMVTINQHQNLQNALRLFTDFTSALPPMAPPPTADSSLGFVYVRPLHPMTQSSEHAQH